MKLPEKFTRLRPVQAAAVDAIIDAWTRVPIVTWQAPTGTGKTIGAVVAAQRAQAIRTLYVCTGKQLQDQFARDFPDAAVLKGRSNYPTDRRGFTAADCNKIGQGEKAVCAYCSNCDDCAYTVAKQKAVRAELACVNTSYLLTEANGPGAFSKRELIVADEADELENEMMRALEFTIGPRVVGELGLETPKKGVHAKTIVAWLGEVSEAAMAASRKIRVPEEWSEEAVAAKREQERWSKLAFRAAQMAGWYGEEWVRTYNDETFTLKPVTVAGVGQSMLWRHSKRWLVMSATILSPERFAADLGIPDGAWEFVDSESTFPPANRPVVVCGVASMNKKNMEDGDATERMVEAIQAVVDRHSGENVLVHTHTYALAGEIVDHLRPGDGREVYRYGSSRDREQVVERFRRTGGVLVAPSLARGVDLPDDLCRVAIIAKCPFGYLGDPQISARMHRDGGEVWYSMRTARDIVQMCGRGVRHEGDWAVTYVLDGQFLKTVWRKKWLFPAWWREAVVMATARQVLEGRVELPERVAVAQPKPQPKPRPKP